MIFDLSEGIKPRIEKALKTSSTDREELKQESSQVESFGLKTFFFFFVSIGRKQVRSIET